MSETANNNETPEPKLTPLQRLKQRQMAEQKNRATKEKRPDPTSEAGGSSDGSRGPSLRQMRSSSNKAG